MDFLRNMTSRSGRNLITGPHKTRKRKDANGKPTDQPSWDEHWIDFNDDNAIRNAINRVNAECTGVYYALGTFQQPSREKRYNRRASNCTHLKAFWFDVDCGEEKWVKHGGVGCYRTKNDGVMAFASFINATGLPLPTHIVNSGAGFHVYWQLDKEITRQEWHGVALMLKSLCNHFGFQADPARTADASSVLRVPSTMHKSGVTVQVTTEKPPISFEVFKQAIEVHKPIIVSAMTQNVIDKTMGLGDKPDYLTGDIKSSLNEQELNTPKKFANIIAKSELEGNGCNQLYQMYLNQEHVSEPMWTAGLSIAKFCEDGEAWAIKMSENHPEFDPAVTIKKMEQWVAPRTCKWFSENNPEGCKGCPFFKTMTDTQSPIRLAVEDNRVPVVVKEMIAGENGETEEFVIPAYPFPFFRHPEQGGIWQTADDGPKLIYDMDLYIYDRIGLGADNKPRFWARHHTPHDGVCEMELTTDDIFITATESMRKLAQHNVLLPTDAALTELNKMLRQQAAQLQRTRPMLQPNKQLGWTNKDTFVLGRWEYSKAGRKMTPVPDSNIARMFRDACEARRDFRLLLDGWNEALKALYGAKDAARYRLILAAGVGASLRARYGSEVGGVINIYSEDSGFGKSTLTKVISGIFSQTPDPFFYQARQGTTINAFFEIISYVNSLPMTLDETGQLEVEDLMLFVHTCTSGRAKARSSKDFNDIRQALPGWKSHVFSSSNVSLWNRITEHRAENEAYLMRIVEIPIRALEQSNDKTYGDEAVREVQKYYGVAGPALLEYAIANDDEIRAMWIEMSKELSQSCGLHGRHRFWGDIMTAAVVGARVGNAAGIFPFDAREVYRTAQEILRELKARADGKVVKDVELFGEMLNYYAPSTIVVKNSRTSSAPIKAPTNKAYVRIELDDRKLYIDYVGLREFAKLRQFGIERLETAIEEVGGQRGVMKQLWANTDFGTGNPPVRTWCIDLTNPKAKQYIDPEDFYDETGKSRTRNAEIERNPYDIR